MSYKHYILSFSGGKDSTATLLYLLKEKGLRPHVIFCDTGNETPETYRYVDYISGLIESWGHPPIIKLCGEYNFYSLAKKKHRFPSIKARFCTEWLKIVPFLRWLEAQPFADDCVIITGIRRSESRNRSNRQEWEQSNMYGRIQWNPAVTWSAKEVFAIHEKYGVEPNPMYKMGFKRVGCFPCCSAGRLELLLLDKYYPERIKEIARQEKETKHSYLAPRKKELFLQPWYIGKEFIITLSCRGIIWDFSKHLQWAKKEMNGQQSLPIKAQICAYADLGLCE